jgi:hypothetical protein
MAMHVINALGKERKQRSTAQNENWLGHGNRSMEDSDIIHDASWMKGVTDGRHHALKCAAPLNHGLLTLSWA